MILRSRRRALREANPAVYDREYFLGHCGGHELYHQSRGARLDRRLAVILQMGHVQTGMRVLDLGCGRGELVRHAGGLGARCWGLDLAPDALSLSRETLMAAAPHVHGRTGLVRATAGVLPFLRETFDRVFLSDILEHLKPKTVRKLLREINRVLKTDGWILFHTFPNRWFYSLYYPIHRLFWDFPRRTSAPRDPRTTYERCMHVNELSPLDLVRAFRPLFNLKIWCAHRDRWRSFSKGFQGGRGPLALIAEPEIWGRAIKRRGGRSLVDGRPEGSSPQAEARSK